MSAEEHRIIEKECQEMLKKGVILWNSLVMLVAKKNCEVPFCVDYRRLNSLLVKDSYPLHWVPLAYALCKYFCAMALGFWQLAVWDEDMCKTTFSTRDGLYEPRTDGKWSYIMQANA